MAGQAGQVVAVATTIHLEAQETPQAQPHPKAIMVAVESFPIPVTTVEVVVGQTLLEIPQHLRQAAMLVLAVLANHQQFQGPPQPMRVGVVEGRGPRLLEPTEQGVQEVVGRAVMPHLPQSLELQTQAVAAVVVEAVRLSHLLAQA